jgi:hypothetical protein
LIILQCYHFNIDLAIQAQHNSSISYGSEFRPVSELSKIFSSHPLWKFLSTTLINGATFPLTHIPDDIRREDILFHKERGNHKLAITHSKKIQELIQEDVNRGFALILPVEILQFIPNASLAPLGCQEQSTINTSGERVSKFRMNHDQSF